MAIRWRAMVLLAAVAGCNRPSPTGGAPQAADAMSGRAVAAPSPLPSLSPVRAMDDPPEAKEARERLVLGIQAAGDPWDQSGPWDPKVLEAMRLVPRHLFMPGATLRRAYADQPSPIGFGQTISQPTVVAIMTDALEVKGGERVLEIGTGSGYQAAILSVLVREVFTIEIVAELGEMARRRLAELGYKNVYVRIGDGYQGWPDHAPFDRVLLTAAPPEIPRALVDQLRDGGILVAPVGEDGELQRLVRWRKVGATLQKEDLGSVRFVPMVPQPP